MNKLLKAALQSTAVIGAMFFQASTGLAEETVNTGTTTYQGNTTLYGSNFLGIPYAAPPAGELRWSAPEPAVIGSEFQASQIGSPCPQEASPYGIASENEDCLSLNVYRPKPKQNQETETKLPVVVWIHGGSFETGFGGGYDPEKLVKKNLMVVTINYRLGALGFLSHPALSSETNDGTSGNYGLMDQQAALRWVQSNIAAFGGDIDNVTLMGHSAGGYSVLSHLVSPDSAGLFHKAIIQSGVYTLEQPLQQEWEAAGQYMANEMGCVDQSADCLRQLDVATILANQIDAGGAYPIVVDGVTMPQQIATAIQSGQFHQVPVMNGSTSDEFSLYVAALNDLAENPVTEENYSEAILNIGIPEELVPFAEAEYPTTDYDSPALALTAIGTDAVFSCSAQAMSSWLSNYVHTWAYEFADPNPKPLLPPVSFPYGAFHGSEVQYLMKLASSEPGDKNTAQKVLELQMLSYWASFAKYGNPNVNLAPYWFRFKTSFPVMQRLKPWFAQPMLNFHFKHHCDFWYGFAEG